MTFRRDVEPTNRASSANSAGHQAILRCMKISPATVECVVHQRMIDQDFLRERLQALKTEHRDLDDVIQRLADQGGYDQLQLQRLKKRKLVLRDQIIRLESQLLPDIIA